jgi:hypothetical protein
MLPGVLKNIGKWENKERNIIVAGALLSWCFKKNREQIVGIKDGTKN